MRITGTFKVSVCLAAYNGERFISEQVRSILSQLGPLDELIICDDGSGDGTRDVVTSIDDPRLVLRSFSLNVGHVRNFERAISIATGDLIFLSDQDDVWSSGKYDMVVDCFLKNPDVQFVHHAVSTIDSCGNTLSQFFNPLHEGRQTRILYLFRQLFKCQVIGCAVAFRSSLKCIALPFPAMAYAHDHWLAIVAGVFGQVYFLNKPLVRYRWHTANLSPRNGLAWRDKVVARLRFLAMIAVAVFCRRRRRIAQH